MHIMISNIRIKNFRSIQDLDLVLGYINVLIGQNNCGKSNFLKAINVALSPNSNISDEDIFSSKNERKNKTKEAIIDIKIKPIDNKRNQTDAFSDYWTSVFTNSWIATDETDGDYVGIRTILKYEDRRGGYISQKFPIMQWNTSIESAVVHRRTAFTSDMMENMVSLYMDAQRDVVEDLRDKKSFFGKSTSEVDLEDKKIQSIERRLNKINNEIISSIPALVSTSQKISAIGSTIGAPNSKVEIEPVARTMTDLHKGMDITFQDGESAKLAISQHGMGTRSWISFLTLGAYVDWTLEHIKTDDEEAENFIMLTMEEPEAHLHPHAQRQLYKQISNFNGQKIITTHSPTVIAQTDLEELVYFKKLSGKTSATMFEIKNFSQDELNKIKREVIMSKGELLFSSGIVLTEGITEEQALPIYFKEYFGIEPMFAGVSIIGIGGQNYKTFLSLIKNFEIPWFIFSDGENSTIKTVKKAVKVITSKNITALKNVVILDDEADYEKNLINEGYSEQMIKAIDKYHIDPEDENTENYFNKYVERNNHQKTGRKKTNKPPCAICGQDIFENGERNYDGDEGKLLALYDCCVSKDSKAKYATCIAEEIVANTDITKRIPEKIKKLFDAISLELKLSIKEEHRER